MLDDELTKLTTFDEPDEVSLGVDLGSEEAERTIDRAVSGRRGLARKYVRWVRRRSPDSTPDEIVTLLERHYVSAISAAGMAVTVGTIAAEVGIAMIPGVGAAAVGTKAVGKEVAKKTTREVAKAAAKAAAKGGAQRAVSMVPAGDEQIQFEITALFALALADLHSLEFDKQQAQALVYLLSNERVGQQQIAAMASGLAGGLELDRVRTGHVTASGRNDWSHWASTLADSLPGDAAQTLVRGVQTGVLEDVRAGLDTKHQTALDYGASSLVSGITRFVFGRAVVEASHNAFPQVPTTFPGYLDVPAKPEKDSDEPSRALAALEDAARSVSEGVGARAAAVGTGVVMVAGAATRVFRRVDLDGDGVPDEPQALTAVKGLGKSMTSPLRLRKMVRRDAAGLAPGTDLGSSVTDVATE